MKNKFIEIFKNTKIDEQDIINDLDRQIDNDSFSLDEFNRTSSILLVKKKKAKIKIKTLIRIGLVATLSVVIMCFSLFAQGNNYLISDKNIMLVDENIRITLNEKNEIYRNININKLIKHLELKKWKLSIVAESYLEKSYVFEKNNQEIKVFVSNPDIKQNQLILCGPYEHGNEFNYKNEKYYVFENEINTCLLKYGKNKYFYILSNLNKEDLIKILS